VKQKKLSEKELAHLFELSKLELAEGEADEYATQLGEILNYVGQLSSLELDEVEETNQVTGLVNVFDEDKTREGLDHSEAMSQVPVKKDGYVMVKAVLGGGDE